MQFEPSKEEIKALLCRPFELLTEATNSFTILEADIMKYANVRKRLSLNLTEEKEDYDKVINGKKRVLEYIEDGFKEPEEIMNDF